MYFLIGLFAVMIGYRFGFFIGVLAFLVLSILLRLNLKYKKSQEAKQEKQNDAPVYIPQTDTSSAASYESEPFSIENTLVEKFLQYFYHDVPVVGGKYQNPPPSYEDSLIGQMVSFIEEPENPADPKALAVYTENMKLGYLQRGSRLRQMVFDYQDHEGKDVIATISSVDPENKYIHIDVGFYFNPEYYDEEQLANFKTIKATLVRTSLRDGDGKNPRQDCCMCLSDGDRLELMKTVNDSGEEIYLVYNKDYNVAGELSLALSNKLLPLEEDHNFYTVVEEPTISSNGRFGANLIIYLIPIFRQ